MYRLHKILRPFFIFLFFNDPLYFFDFRSIGEDDRQKKKYGKANIDEQAYFIAL
jgi:hypothetical protein